MYIKRKDFSLLEKAVTVKNVVKFFLNGKKINSYSKNYIFLPCLNLKHDMIIALVILPPYHNVIYQFQTHTHHFSLTNQNHRLFFANIITFKDDCQLYFTQYCLNKTWILNSKTTHLLLKWLIFIYLFFGRKIWLIFYRFNYFF